MAISPGIPEEVRTDEVIPACLGDRFGFEPEVRQQALTTVCPEANQIALTPFTSMFIHGGFLHLLGNMIFLWVFGDNVEDAMGHGRYLVFYLLAGLGAAALQVYVDQDSVIPMVGASGAIAGVLGAYLVLYPRATVSVVIPWLWFFGAFPVPAAFLIVFWFLLQLLSGVASLGATEGIAFWAHVGGFIAGVVLVWAFRRQKPRRRRPPAVVW